MSDRFYAQQLKTLGNCPGNKNPTKRKRKVAWDDDKKAQAVALYEEADPTPETSMEIVSSYLSMHKFTDLIHYFSFQW
jgi:hypothetical protein